MSILMSSSAKVSTNGQQLFLYLTQEHPDAVMDYFESTDSQEEQWAGALLLLGDLMERSNLTKHTLYKFILSELRQVDDTLETITENTSSLYDASEEILTTCNLIEEEDQKEDHTSEEEYKIVILSMTFKKAINLSTLEGICQETSLDTNAMDWL